MLLVCMYALALRDLALLDQNSTWSDSSHYCVLFDNTLIRSCIVIVIPSLSLIRVSAVSPTTTNICRCGPYYYSSASLSSFASYSSPAAGKDEPRPVTLVDAFPLALASRRSA
jgi:hypothetical protein